MISKKRGVTLVILVLFLIVLSFSTISEEPLEEISFSNNDIVDSYEALLVFGNDQDDCNSANAVPSLRKDIWGVDKFAGAPIVDFWVNDYILNYEQGDISRLVYNIAMTSSDIIEVEMGDPVATKTQDVGKEVECSWLESLNNIGCYIFANNMDKGNVDDCAGALLESGYIFDQSKTTIEVGDVSDSEEPEEGYFRPLESGSGDDAINNIFNCDTFSTPPEFSLICADKEYTFLNQGNQQVTENKKVWLECNEDEVDNYIQLARETEVFIESEVDEPELTATEKATEIVITEEVYQCQLLEDNYVWVNIGDLTCDLVNCDNYKEVCENNKYSWVGDSQTGQGVCCGDDGIDDFTELASFDNSNYICLKNDDQLLGASPEGKKVFDDCGGNQWCWVNAIGVNNKFNIFTIKKPGEMVYDIVSDSENWITCNAGSPETLDINSISIVGDNNYEYANRFQCYFEGNHWAWAECAGTLKNPAKATNIGTIKGRYAGDSLYSLFIPGATEGVKYDKTIQLNTNDGNYDEFYSKNDYFDFTGYDLFNFMVKFVVDETGTAKPFKDLELPTDVRLQIKDSNGNHYFDQNILGYAINKPLFSEDGWMHIQVPIDGYKFVDSIIINSVPNPDFNLIGVRNVYLSKSGVNTKICSGEDSVAYNNWLEDFDQSLPVSSMELCNAIYGENAWLGDANKVKVPAASCCGNNENEYYSGDSQAIGGAIGGDPGTKYGCWNSQPIANEQTIMDVEYIVDYTVDEPVIKYDPVTVTADIEYILSVDYENTITELNADSGSSSTSTEILQQNVGDTHLFSSTIMPQTSLVNKVVFSNVIDISLAVKNGMVPDFYDPTMPVILTDATINNPTPDTNIYFLNTITGETSETLTDLEPAELNDIEIVTELLNVVPTVTPNLISKTNVHFNYPCSVSPESSEAPECLFPLPGIPASGITVTNLYPDLYELYFVTFDAVNQQEIYQLIDGSTTVTELANLQARKVAQQVVFVSPADNLLGAETILNYDPGFYGCQAADFIENKKDALNNPILTLDGNPLLKENLNYCHVRANYFCAPSANYIVGNDQYTTINSWSDDILTKIGYAPFESDFEDDLETHFEQLDLKLIEGASEPSHLRNYSAKVLPAKNFIPNAEFIAKNNKLPHWDVFAGSIVENYETADVEKKFQQVNILPNKILRTEQIAVPKNSNLRFSQSGTAPFSITLVDKDGVATSIPGTNPVQFPTNQASYLIIEFKGAGNVKEPFLQLIDSGLAPITDYSYTPEDEIDRSGLACCPQDHCWNGYACIAPMGVNDYVQMSEHLEEGRDYRCIAGQWKNSPVKWDWNAENWGFCDDKKQCFVYKEGVAPPNDLNTGLPNELGAFANFVEGNSPICIDDEDYLFDHYCEDGDWSSRTKFLATKLLEVAEIEGDYVLYCTDYRQALPNYKKYEDRLGGISEVTSEEVQDLGDALTGTSSTTTLNTCFDNLPGNLIDDKENTCVNNVCVLKFDDGAKSAFGTTLNKDITSPDSFLQTLGITQNFETICAGTGDVIECSASLEGDLWYIPELQALIYSKEGIQLTSTIFDTVIDWFKDLFGIDAELSGQSLFVNEAKNFKDLYLLSKDDKKAKVIKEIFPENKTLIAEFENFQTPVCDYVNAYKKSPLFALEDLEEVSGFKRISCVVDEVTNIQSVEIAADDEALDFVWPQLTGKLRVEE